jgi:hypothetical protein
VRAQHVSDLDALYDKTPQATGDVLTPKTVKMAVTPFILPAEGEPPPLEVPLAAMIQPNPLMVDEINFEIDCVALNLQLGPPGSAPESLKTSEIEIGFGGPGAPGCPMKLSIRYKSGQPPQVNARIGDALIRGVQ